MNPVKLGVIGCGVIGSRHVAAAAASTQIDLAAVADLRTEVAAEIAAKHGVPTVYGPAEELLADSAIEAVVLAMPAHVRTALALKAFAQGKHVLTEKPVAMNAAEVRRLLVAKGDLIAACCSSRYHFLAATKTVTDFLAGERLGKLRLLRCRAIVPAASTQTPIHRRGGSTVRSTPVGSCPTGAAMIWIISLASPAGSVQTTDGAGPNLDHIPSRLSHYAGPGSDAETHVAALIRCTDEISISYERAEFVTATQAELAWEIIGEDGSLRLQMTPATGKSHLYFQVDAALGTLSGTLCRADEDHGSVHTGPVNDFAHAIRSGHAPQTDLHRALIIQSVTDAIYESSANGVAVTIATE